MKFKEGKYEAIGPETGDERFLVRRAAEHLGEDRNPSEYTLEVIHVADKRSRESVLADAKTLTEIRHPGILHYEDYWEEGNVVYILAKAMREQTLAEVVALEDWQNVRYEKVMEYTEQLADALAFMHSKGLMHRELKPASIYFTPDQLIIGGFGRACQQTDNMAFDKHSCLFYTNKADVWSVGCVLYEMIMGHPPFNPLDGHRKLRPMSEFMQDMRDRRYQSVSHMCCRAIRELVDDMLSFEEIDRPDMKSILFAVRHIRRLPMGPAETPVPVFPPPPLWDSMEDMAKDASDEMQDWVESIVSETEDRLKTSIRIAMEARIAVGEKRIPSLLALSNFALTGEPYFFLALDQKLAEIYQIRLKEGIEERDLDLLQNILDTILQLLDTSGPTITRLRIDSEKAGLYSMLHDCDQSDVSPSLAEKVQKARSLLKDPEENLKPAPKSKNIDKAETLFLECFEKRRTHLGMYDAETLSTIHDLSCVYQAQGRYLRAESLLIECWYKQLYKLGAAHKDTLTTLYQLGLIYQDQQRYDKAEPTLLHCLYRQTKLFGRKHVDTLLTFAALAHVAFRQGFYERALALHAETLKNRRQALGETHPDTITSLFDMANVLCVLGKYDRAEPYFVDAIDKGTKKLGPTHHDLTSWKSHYKNFLKMLSRNDEADRV
eukprot:Rmarinus@m.24425